MKFIKVLILVLFVFGFLFGTHQTIEAAFAPYRKLCVGIQGKFITKNWKGGPIEVGCAGDDGGRVPASQRQDKACLGEVQTVQPGKAFRLTKCSCFGSDKGCLKIGKDLKLEPLNSNNRRTITVVKRIDELPAYTNNNCTRKRTGNVCGSNGQRIEANVVIKCAVPTKTNTPTPTGQICPKPDKVTNVKITCPNCSEGAEAVSPTPLPPTPTQGQTAAACQNTSDPVLEVVGQSQKTSPLSNGTATYSLKIINCSTTASDLSLNLNTTNAGGWTADYPSSSEEVAAGQSTTKNVTIAAPTSGVSAGDSKSFVFNALRTGTGNAGASDTVTLMLTLTQ